MYLTETRVSPLEESEVPADLHELLADWYVRGRLYNIFLTLARHPPLLRAWLPYGTHTFKASALTPRSRELVVLRTAWVSGSPYEFGHHVRPAMQSGITVEEIERVKLGPADKRWSTLDAALLRSVDELEDHACVSDDTWADLSAALSQAQVLDVIYTFGAYRTTAGAMNSLGVRVESGIPAPQELMGPKGPKVNGK